MMQHKTAPLTSSTLVAAIGLALMCGVALVAIAEASAAGTVRGAADLSRTTGSANDSEAAPSHWQAQAGGDSESPVFANAAGGPVADSNAHRRGLTPSGACWSGNECISRTCR
jgi:hypothetical protein